MKNLFSTRVSESALAFALLLLRVGFGGLMAFDHGWDKLTHFNATVGHFQPMLGLSPTTAVALVTFAEFFCALFVLAGLFTRLATIPLIIAMGVAFVKAHGMNWHGGPGGGQVALLFLIAFTTLLFTGPGKFSMDKLIGK